MSQPIKLAVLISGNGTTLQNLIDHIQAGKLCAEIVVVISSKPGAYGLVRAQRHGIPTHVVPRKAFADLTRFNEAINQILHSYAPDLIVLAGFLSLFQPAEPYRGKVMNIHPALIPAFCGKGYYGRRVHQAVLDYGVKISGCTVHFIDEHYDSGPIILQSAVPVKDDDTVETLAARVFQEECKLYPRAIQLYAEGKLRVEGRRVKICEDDADT
ncbi:MAG: phosphoribosylglycinamide formyltransferase [Nitrospinota bacterium]|nr:MAG: phosphoribosylglycinamide formyltransferase [Nitrospinota bacterium]